jgi:hypothetical protein
MDAQIVAKHSYAIREFSLLVQGLGVMVLALAFNATFNSISVISWRSVLLVEETRENHRPAASH